MEMVDVKMNSYNFMLMFEDHVIFLHRDMSFPYPASSWCFLCPPFSSSFADNARFRFAIAQCGFPIALLYFFLNDLDSL